MKIKVRISFDNRDKIADLMAKVDPTITVETLASLVYGKRPDGSEYIRRDDLVKWFEEKGVPVKHSYRYSPCNCGILGCENTDDVYTAVFNYNPYTNLILV